MKRIQVQKAVTRFELEADIKGLKDYIEEQMSVDIGRMAKQEGLIQYESSIEKRPYEEKTEQRVLKATLFVMPLEELSYIIKILDRIQKYHGVKKPIEAIKYVLEHGIPKENESTGS